MSVRQCLSDIYSPCAYPIGLVSPRDSERPIYWTDTKMYSGGEGYNHASGAGGVTYNCGGEFFLFFSSAFLDRVYAARPIVCSIR